MIKFNDYLDKILTKNRQILTENMWEEKHHRPENIKPMLHVPSKEELEEKFGGKFEDVKILGRIGSTGKEIHRITADMLNTSTGYIVWSANSYCGSQKWNVDNPSPLFVLDSDDLTKITCDRCLGKRVKGGKDAGKPKTQYKCYTCGYTGDMREFKTGMRRLVCPKCRKIGAERISNTKPNIDIDSRPKQYKFSYKLDDRTDIKLACPTNGHVEQNYPIKGMTEEEAINKLLRQELGGAYPYHSRLYGVELIALYAWNGNTIWRKSRDPENSPQTTSRTKVYTISDIQKVKRTATKPVVKSTTRKKTSKTSDYKEFTAGLAR